MTPRRSIPLFMTAAGTLAAVGAPLASAASSHTYRGQTSNMRWGPVQVSITVSGRRLTAVSASYPTERARSQVINSGAIPTLRSEALRAQSYRIHSVSGATLTSHSFVNSLYSAMHAAHLA